VQFAGVIIRQEQAFALGIHHHKGRRTLAVKSQCLVGQQAALSGPPLYFFWSFASSMVLDGKLL
jgi:ABC-type enterochelin transport system permease subunit